MGLIPRLIALPSLNAAFGLAVLLRSSSVLLPRDVPTDVTNRISASRLSTASRRNFVGVGTTAMLSLAPILPAHGEADDPELIKELLKRTAQNKEANERAVLKRSGASALPFGSDSPTDGGGFRPLSLFSGNDKEVFVTYASNGAQIELSGPEADELKRVGRLTKSKTFGKGPDFLVVTDKAPVKFLQVPLMREPSSPMDFNLELKGAALEVRESELAIVRASVDEKLAKSGPVTSGWVAPVFKGERPGEVGMCGVGVYAHPCDPKFDTRAVAIPDLVLPSP